MFFKPKQEKFFLVLSDDAVTTASEPTPIASEPAASPSKAPNKAPKVDPPTPKATVQAPAAPIQTSVPASTSQKPASEPAALAPLEPPYPLFPSRRRPGPSLDRFTRMAKDMNR